ncbi:putative g-protein coupled receptor fragment [Schistosoma mansoni]|uniref:putative g-protein coupled receptor fragment n=1 Tax=Schistosoma mansoni TaxID=6183 RepID=UPI0001A627A9|nr:putative g-protein coupled receptor fragment [Schistosoma mansoni]
MKPPEIPLFGRIIIAVIVSILVVFSTLGNTLVLCVLNRKRTSSQQSQRKTESVVQCYGKHHSLQTSMIGITLAKRSVTYIFLVNLSLSDLLHILICAPFTLVADFLLIYWPFGGILCRLVNYLQGVVVFICAFTHVIISIDRLTAVRCPIWRRRNLSVTNARMILLLIWCCAMIISIPSLIVCQIIVDKDGLTHLFEEFNDSNQISLELIYNWLIILFQYILPLFVIIITYSAIICQIWISTIPGEGNVHRIERSRASRKECTGQKGSQFTIKLIIKCDFASDVQ